VAIVPILFAGVLVVLGVLQKGLGGMLAQPVVYRGGVPYGEVALSVLPVGAVGMGERGESGQRPAILSPTAIGMIFMSKMGVEFPDVIVDVIGCEEGRRM
jgi:hypothetical protein